MRVSVNSCFACFVVLALNLAHAQQRQPPRTDYEFNLSAKGPHLRFKVQLDHDDVPKAVKIFRANEKKSFQTLENCSYSSKEVLTPAPNEPLLLSVDLNFDSYRDLQLLAYTNMPHLGNKFYCVWLWDNPAQRFKLLPQLKDVADPIPDPATHTIRSRRFYLGGPERDQIFLWRRGQLILGEERTLYYGGSFPGCNEYTVETLQNGRLQKTIDKPVEPGSSLDELPSCSVAKPSNGNSR
jgi:hypothetical protein